MWLIFDSFSSICSNFYIFYLEIVESLPEWIEVKQDTECTLMINLRRVNKLARDERAFAPK